MAMLVVAGFKTVRIPTKAKTAGPSRGQPHDFCRSILVRQHDGDCGLRVVHVERATGGNELNQLRTAVVVADIERKRQAVVAGIHVVGSFHSLSALRIASSSTFFWRSRFNGH